MPDELSRLFDRFRRHGDTDGLAIVFDATAPRLMTVAVHLTHDHEAAEDLVQATFLTAIERASEFDAARPLVPWLMGILTNHARNELRRGARRRSLTRASQESAVSAAPGSPDASESDETRELVAAALERLSEPYRSVVLLNVRHGLEPVEIAQALGRSPGAVRTQLYRGLRAVRKWIPVASVFAFVASPPDLYVVRERVLEFASRTSAALRSVGMASKKTPLAITFACVILGIAAERTGRTDSGLNWHLGASETEVVLAEPHRSTGTHEQTRGVAVTVEAARTLPGETARSRESTAAGTGGVTPPSRSTRHTAAYVSAPQVAAEPGYSGTTCGDNVVRASTGTLYMLLIHDCGPESKELRLHASDDGGRTWRDVVSSGITDAVTGGAAPLLLSNASIAIDDTDGLHIHWAAHGPDEVRQCYRHFDPATRELGPPVDLRAAVGAPPSSPGCESNIIVDGRGTVWCVAGSATRYRCQLLRSDAPYVRTGRFSSVGCLSVTSGAQFPRMAVDAAGVIQCTYYNNNGSGDYRHRAFDPSSGRWSDETDLGDLVPSHDYTGAIACDRFGNTHILCNRDSNKLIGSPTIIYVRRSASGEFSPAITVASATNPEYRCTGNRHSLDIACDESTGDVYVLFRDFSRGGELSVHRLRTGAASFERISRVRPPHCGLYETPRIRGTLYPPGNNTGDDLHMTWRERTSWPYDFKFAAVSPGEADRGKYPGNGTAAFISTKLNGRPAASATNEHVVSSPGDLVTLRYESLGGQLAGGGFVSVVQAFPQDSIPDGILLPGDAVGRAILDLNAPMALISNGGRLGGGGGPALLFGSATLEFGFPPVLFDGASSVVLTLFSFDPMNVTNPFGCGVAPAHEFILQ